MVGQRTSTRLGALLVGAAIVVTGCEGTDDRAAPGDRRAAESRGASSSAATPTASPSSTSPSPSGSPTTAAPSPTATPAPAETSDVPGRTPMTVAAPAEGAIVAPTFIVQGKAAAVEGTLIWELRDGQRVVAQGITQAGTITPEPFQFTVTAPRAGRYTIVVYQEAVKDGTKPRYAIHRTITVR